MGVLAVAETRCSNSFENSTCGRLLADLKDRNRRPPAADRPSLLSPRYRRAKVGEARSRGIVIG